MKKLLFTFFLSFTLALSAGIAAPERSASKLSKGVAVPENKVATMTQSLSEAHRQSVVRVNVTDQPYDFLRPWSKRAPVSRRALGVVLAGQRVLVTGELVANASFVELERPDDGEKVAAEIQVVDYQANLAIIKPADPAFLKGVMPIETADARVGDRASIWQLESTGALLATSALVTTVEVSRYPLDETALLLYRVTTSLQYRDGSFTVPVTKDGKLIGLVMRYDPRSQNADVIPSQVILHFLKDAESGIYRGFPKIGCAFAPLRDGQLRRYAGLNGNNNGLNNAGGVYVTNVVKDGPTDKAGVRAGDVLVKVAGKEVDRDGNYLDPLYGKISLTHLISTQCFDGDSTELTLLRGGQPVVVTVKVAQIPSSKSLVEPFTIDRAPRYYVVGGLVLQELSRQYLKEWGDWLKKAPEQFVYMDRYQDELSQTAGRERIVILNQVLPSELTIGYEELGQLVVSKINDVPLKSLADVESALTKPINGFHKIEFDESVKMIFLDAKQVAEQQELLLETYGIPAVKRL